MKKSMDRKLLSKQEHEIAYVRDQARLVGLIARKARGNVAVSGAPGKKAGIFLTDGQGNTYAVTWLTIDRVCKAVLKFARVKKRKINKSRKQ